MALDTGQNAGPRASGQKFRAAGFLALLFLLFGGWALGWNYGAGALEIAARQVLTKLASRGQPARCENLAVKGFPIRIGVFCDRVAVSGQSGTNFGDWRLETGALRSAAQLYNPGHIVSELDGPAVFEGARLPSLLANWSSARASLRLGLDGPKRISAAVNALSLTAFAARPLAEIQIAEIHLRPSAGGNGDGVDLAISAGNALFSFPQPIPPFSASAEGRLDKVWSLAGKELMSVAGLRDFLHKHGLSGEARSVRLEPESGGSISVSGPFEIGSDGLLTAKLAVSVNDPAAILKFVSAALPAGSPAQERLGEIEAVLNFAGVAGKGAPQLVLTIVRGEVSAGVFSLGRIQGLF